MSKSHSGNPVFEGWYADPEIHLFQGRYYIYPTFSAAYEEQTFFEVWSSDDLVTWQNGTMTYTMVRNDRLPLLTPLRWVGLGAVADALDAPLRDKIEYAETGAAYECRNLTMAGLGQGVTKDELRAVRDAFNVDTTLV